MNSRYVDRLLRRSLLFAATFALILSPIAEVNAQRGFFFGRGLFGNRAVSSGSYTTCDPTTGICTTVNAAPTVQYAPTRIVNQERYVGYASTVQSEGSSGSSGYATSSGSTGGVGRYGITLQPGERLVSVSAAQQVQSKNLTALEDGSLLATIMANLEQDPNWQPGPKDDPLLHAAYDFLEAFSQQSAKGAFTNTSLDAKESQATLETPPAPPSLEGRISWQGPPKTASLAKAFSWSPPTLVASR